MNGALRTGIVLAALCAAACGDDEVLPPANDAGQADAAPATCLTEDGRALVEEIVHELLMDAVHSAVYTGAQERGFASQLVGVPAGNIGHLTLFEVCTGPSSYDPYCEYADSPEPPEDPFYEDHDRCLQLGCEAADIGTATLYWTMRPGTDPDARHAFTYQSTAPAGEAVADPNPLLVWRYDLTTADSVILSSELDRALVVTPTGGEAIQLDHTGTITVSQTDGEPTGASLELAFPALLPEGETTIELTLDAEASATGAVSHAGDVIAPISGTFSFDTPLAFDWCAGS